MMQARLTRSATAAAFSLFLFSACQERPYEVITPDEIIFKGTETPGKVTGTVYDENEKPLAGVEVLLQEKGQLSRSFSNNKGEFLLEIDRTDRGAGFNVHFRKQGYITSTRAPVFDLPGRAVNLDGIYMKRENSYAGVK